MLSRILVALTLALTGCARATYFDCILEHTTDAKIVREVRDACAEKYQQPLPPSALSHLKAAIEPSGYRFQIVVENLNRDWMLTEVEYHVTKAVATEQRTLLQKMEVSPLGAGYIEPAPYYSPRTGEQYSWGIVKAWGVPVER